MNLETKHSVYGHSAREHIQTISEEPPIDAVGLWQIVPVGRINFRFSGSDLVSFLRLCITALLEKGAKPVIGGGGTRYDWILQPQYGETIEGITEAVVSEWLANGSPDTDPGGLWFALPTLHVGQQSDWEPGSS